MMEVDGSLSELSAGPKNEPSLPLEVIERVLEICNSLELALKFRLVCRSWNTISCHVLRKILVFTVDERKGARLEEFESILRDRSSKFPSDWPQPFKGYHLSATSFTQPMFAQFVQREDFRVRSMTVKQQHDFNYKVFERVMNMNHKFVEILSITANVNAPLAKYFSLLYNWTSLSTIRLNDDCNGGSLNSAEPCAHTIFLKALTFHRTVQSLALSGHLLQHFSSYLSGTWPQLSSLEIGYLESDRVLGENIVKALSSLSMLDLPALRELVLHIGSCIHFFREANDPAFNRILALLWRLMPKLVKFQWNIFPLRLVPPGPKLQSLTCGLYDGDRYESVTPSKFPALAQLSSYVYWRIVPHYIPPSEMELHGRVGALHVHFHKDSRGIGTVWPSSGRQFPNLHEFAYHDLGNTINFHRGKLNLDAVGKCFPGLRTLAIPNVRTHELVDSPMDGIQAYLEGGWPVEDLCHAAPLTNFTELTSLKVGSLLKLTKEVIVYGLARIPKLKFLTICPFEHVIVPEFSQYLSHLEEIQCLCYNDTFEQRARELSKTLTCVRVKRCD